MLKILNFIEKIVLNKYLLSFVFMFTFVVVCLIVWTIFFPDYVNIDLDIMFLVKILLVYLDIFIFLQILKTYDKDQFNIWKLFFIIKLFVLFLFWALLVTKWFDPKAIYFLLITAIIVIFFIDSRIVLLFCLNYFVFTFIYTIFGYKELAFEFANNFYYFFMIWIIILLLEQVLLHKSFK